MLNIFEIKCAEDENEKLKKALDKACELLAKQVCTPLTCPKPFFNNCGKLSDDKPCEDPEAWKEWLLRDD